MSQCSHYVTFANSIAKRSCLICLHDRKVLVDDTDWHLLFGCSATAEHRSKYVASLKDGPLPAASLPTSPSISTLVNHFLFARESSDNLRIFAQFVKDRLQARQRRLRRVQAQCPDSIFIEAATCSQESSIICSPVSQESQPKRVPRLKKSDCPACRNQHRAHTRVGFCRLASKEDGQRQNAQPQREQSDTNSPAPVEASHRKRQAHPKSSPKKQQMKQAKKA